jgi:hypothetical protein
MEPLDRRSFLGSSLAVTTGAALPGWLAQAFAPQDPLQDHEGVPGPARVPLLRAQAKLAREHGKPLLVFVVPKEPALLASHGQWLGTWLTTASADTRATIAACVPVAATVPDVQAVFGAVPIEGKPMLLLVDVAKFGEEGALVPRVTTIALPPAPKAADRSDFTTALTKAFGDALYTHAGELDAMAQRVRDRLPPEQLAALQAWSDGGAVPADAVLLRTAALVRCMAASWATDVRQPRLDLAGAAHTRELLGKTLPGSLWGSSFGCGGEIVGVDGKTTESMIACGRGHVPPASRRFLYFYTKTS